MGEPNNRCSNQAEAISSWQRTLPGMFDHQWHFNIKRTATPAKWFGPKKNNGEMSGVFDEHLLPGIQGIEIFLFVGKQK